MDLKLVGNMAFQAGDFHGAEQLYAQALAVNELPELLANRAACRLHLGKYREAAQDCERGQTLAAAPPLRTKMWWRQAVALRMLGEDRAAWERAVTEGLRLDPANEKLRAEQKFVFVDSRVPDFLKEPPTQVLSAPEGVPTSSETAPATAPATAPPARGTPDFLPSLPLTYTGVLQLVRNRTQQAYQFFYDNVTGDQLRAALARPGVEPDVLDYFHGMVLANPEQRLKNAEFLRALEASPRYDMALFMADDRLSARVQTMGQE